jgi:hypothetical protein
MRAWPTSTSNGGPISMIAFATQAVWLVYPVYAVLIGGLFAWLHRGETPDIGSAALRGALYGFGWWLLASLVLVPGLLGHPPFSPSAVEMMRHPALPLLAGHLVYGVTLGSLFSRIGTTLGRPRRPGAMQQPTRHAA